MLELKHFTYDVNLLTEDDELPCASEIMKYVLLRVLRQVYLSYALMKHFPMTSSLVIPPLRGCYVPLPYFIHVYLHISTDLLYPTEMINEATLFL